MCKKKETIDIIEGERHIWLDFKNNGRAAACVGNSEGDVGETPSKNRGQTSLQLIIRGETARSFENEYSKDSSKTLCIPTLIIVRAIWKSRNKYLINDRDVGPIETGETLKELIREQMRKVGMQRVP